jgi:hypothetical protein
MPLIIIQNNIGGFMDIKKELTKVAKEIGEFDERHANEVYDVADETEKVADIYDELEKTAQEIESLAKTASLLNPGDRIVCLNPVQGVYKGRIYLLKEFTDDAKNYSVVSELDGSPVGIYATSRFALDNKEY